MAMLLNPPTRTPLHHYSMSNMLSCDHHTPQCTLCHAWYNARNPQWASFSNDRDDGWRCPGCQSLNTKVPTRYLCFCGRVENPSFASGNPPHTCGDPCHRPRDCGHDCTDPCHAGPCLPCPVMVPKSCFCGKSVASVRCSTEVKVTTCGETCGRPLGCGLHTCEEVCHAGPCKPCPIVESQECFCGLTESERPCGTGQAVDPSAPDVRKFSCGGVCNAALECGNHQCANPCHPGPCPPCPLLPEVVTSCPCGKTQLYVGDGCSIWLHSC